MINYISDKFPITMINFNSDKFLSQGYIGRKNVDLEDVKNKSWT